MEPVPTVGHPFDYNLHEAVMRQPSSEYAEVSVEAAPLLLHRCSEFQSQVQAYMTSCSHVGPLLTTWSAQYSNTRDLCFRLPLEHRLQS